MHSRTFEMYIFTYQCNFYNQRDIYYNIDSDMV